MPEIDFIQTQLARADERSVWIRWRDRLGLGLLLLLMFAVFMVGLTIEDATLLLGYIAVVTVVVLLFRRAKFVNERLTSAIARDRPTVFIVLAMLAISYPIILSGDPYLIHIAAIAGIFVIMALGLNISLGFAGVLDVGFSVYFAAGAYTSAQLAVLYDVPFWIGLPLAGLSAAFFGFIIAWPALRVQGHYLAMVTLGYGLIMNMLHRNLKSITNGTDGVLNIPPPSLGGHSFFQDLEIFGLTLPFQSNFYFLVLLIVVFTILVSYRIKYSNIGRCWEAMREDEVAAKCFGIDVTRSKVLAFSTGAFFGGIGGALFAHMIGFIHPDNFILLTSITILAMVLIGGMGNIWGVAIGAILLIFIPERLREFENLRMLLFGGAMALIMIYRPQGLFPDTRRRRELAPEVMEGLIERSNKSIPQAQQAQ